jgi:ATP-binding cassette subfamily B protein
MATHPKAASTDVDAIESGDAGIGVSLVRIGKILSRPELAKWRPVMALALLLTIGSKFFIVYAPVYFGDAINRMTTPTPRLRP